MINCYHMITDMRDSKKRRARMEILPHCGVSKDIPLPNCNSHDRTINPSLNMCEP